MRAQVDEKGKPAVPAGGAAGPDRKRSGEPRSFNDGLGEKLNAAGDAPATRGKGARIWAGLAIALAAAGLYLATNMWIGN